MAEIDGFEEDSDAVLQNRAQEFVANRNKEFAAKSKELKIDASLESVAGLDQGMIIKLAENGVKNIDDLADLAADELIEILGDSSITETEANEIIMSARQHWFEDEDKTEE